MPRDASFLRAQHDATVDGDLLARDEGIFHQENAG
jgi:hypothetical protein